MGGRGAQAVPPDVVTVVVVVGGVVTIVNPESPVGSVG